MANDLVPSPPSSPLEAFIKQFNLPEVIAGPAGKAIGRLVASVVEIPAAYLDDFAHGIRNRTSAKQVVNNEVAAAAARLASNDHDIVARAAHNLIAKEYRRQKNKEDIAIKTIDILAEELAHELTPQQPKPGETGLPPQDVDEDWLNVFEKYAEDASSEKMQMLWARVLAGEIHAPTRYSLKTLRFLAELDAYTAQLFEKYTPMVCNETFMPTAPRSDGVELNELLHLENAGVVTGAGGLLHWSVKVPPSGIFLFMNQKRIVMIKASPSADLKFSCILLTTIGKELLTIIEKPFDIVQLKAVVDRLPKQTFSSVELPAVGGPGGVILMPGEVIWSKPEEST